MEWFRSWHGAPTDNKWLVVAKRAGVAPGVVSAVFWALLDYASQQNERGNIAGFDVETYALWSGWEEQDVINVMSAMRAKGIITDGDTLSAWDKRQPKREDDSRERVRKYRERQKTTTDEGDVTYGNASVTHGNAPEKNREDTEQIREITPNGAVPQAQPVLVPAESKPTKKVAASQAEAWAWIEALCYAFEDDPKIPGMAGKYGKLGKGYARAGYTPDDVRMWKDHLWQTDWRCEKGHKPSKAALDERLPEIREHRLKGKRARQVHNVIDQNGNVIDTVEVPL